MDIELDLSKVMDKVKNLKDKIDGDEKQNHDLS